MKITSERRVVGRQAIEELGLTGWLYRGMRWRVVGHWRRMYWFGRRMRVRAIGRYRRVNRSGRLGLGTRRSGYVAIRSGYVAMRSQLAVGPSRQVFAELDAGFVELLETAGLAGSGPKWPVRVHRLRLRRRFFGELPGVAAATEQIARLEWPVRWDRALSTRIANSRFVEFSMTRLDSETVLWIVLPILISGRPVATPASPLCAGPVALPEYSAADLYSMDEHELARVALAQLRALLVQPSAEDHLSSRPHVSVVMSTNRPDHVRHAVAQIQNQHSVDIELMIGCHGFSPDEIADLDYELGAVKSATVLSFDETTIFGDVLQALSAQASSPFLAKWDDDDLYGPNHLVDLWLFSVMAGAPLVGKAAEFVLLDSNGLLVRRRGGSIHRSTHFLAGGALLMTRRGLDLIGGWGSLRRSVDQDLIRRFDEAGMSPFRIHGYEFVLVRHSRGHTWDPVDGYFEAAADEIRSADALAITHVGDLADPPIGRAHRSVDDIPTFEICVPNQNQQASVELFEWQRGRMTPPPRLTVCDDRSDPPLIVSSDQAGVQVVRAPLADGFGTGRSRHTAFEHSDADVVVFADADMYIEPRVPPDLSECYQHGFVGAVHAEISFTEVTASELLALSSVGGNGGLSEKLQRRELTGQQWRQPHWAAAADYTHPLSSSYRATVGAFLVIDRTSYIESGGFRDVPVRGVEDIEFGYRLQASGCPQGVWRRGGIWHLGERTFASHIDSAEEDAKHTYLSAYVPIWARNLRERRAALGAWSGEIVPFAELPADTGIVDELNAHFGLGTAIEHGSSTSILAAPFAYADFLAPEYATSAVDAAYKAFRNRRGGVVIATFDGQPVGRFVALWAFNLAARRAGSRSAFVGSPSSAEAADIDRRVQRDLGIIVVSLD